MNQTVRQQKNELRCLFRTERNRLGRNERRRAEQAVIRRLKPLVRRGKKIAAYWAMGSELNLSALFQTASERGATVYLPYIEPNTRRMWFTPYPADGAKQERKRGRAKLHVPQFTGKKIRVHQLSLLLVPIVGIDKRGYRLGQAGGYYDTTLSAMKYRLQTQTLGVGFGCQLTDTLPTEPHDIPLNGFVSELGVLKFRRPRWDNYRFIKMIKGHLKT